MIQTFNKDGVAEVKGSLMINHPKADLMTLNIGQDAFCNFPLTMEIVLQKGSQWLVDVVPELSEYAELISNGQQGYISYQNVPIATVAKFINIYAQ